MITVRLDRLPHSRHATLLHARCEHPQDKPPCRVLPINILPSSTAAPRSDHSFAVLPRLFLLLLLLLLLLHLLLHLPLLSSPHPPRAGGPRSSRPCRRRAGSGGPGPRGVSCGLVRLRIHPIFEYLVETHDGAALLSG
ncbi:hypothetical protein LZ31DRAFT_192468 [Colletotrichum somersetense]|nr:hypothetical protein LZ31DRAFT_192468 [Colletotrichum somersetense]